MSYPNICVISETNLVSAQSPNLMPEVNEVTSKTEVGNETSLP